jgi:hypothetical protein
MSALLQMFAIALSSMTVACSTCPEAEPALGQAPPPAKAVDWRKAEEGIFSDWVQLTFSDRFVKAGESYFSTDDSRIIFQAVEKPAVGEAADDLYAMFVADVTRDASGKITGIDHIKRLSPKGSANTCGWFHPTEPNVVIFASTIVPPTESTPPGFQRASGTYKWMFPPEMRIVKCDLTKADGTAATLETIVGDGKAYRAEGSISPNGRHLLYCSLEANPNDGDLYVYDLHSNKTTRIVQAKGYDGGPFFSPDGKRICYRSDRHDDKMLQLFVADLAFNEQGEIVGIEREYQLTDQACVNWCPFWTRDGRRLVYASSELGESNFEIYMCDADPGNLPGSNGTIRYGTAKRRLTHFEPTNGKPGSDVLPAFSSDGKWVIWTSRRSNDGEVQLVAARFVLEPDAPWKTPPVSKPDQPRKFTNENQIVHQDPESGRWFMYDMSEHVLYEYDMSTHTKTEVTDPADVELFRKLHEAAEEPQ